MLTPPCCPLIFIGVMYFLMIRPQMKRQKEHRACSTSCSKGDEVLTSGGIAGTVTDIGDNFVGVEIATGVQVRLQRARSPTCCPRARSSRPDLLS